jgi:hypothetical protein
MQQEAMDSAISGNCRRVPCANPIPPGLITEQLCLDHFLDEAAVRTDQVLESWSQGAPVDSQSVDWLLADALAVVNNLEAGADDPNPDQRERMLDLLLNLANLHEYVARHPMSAKLPS